MMHQISVGSLVTAKRESAVCGAGEVGVCVATRQVGFVSWEDEPAQPERLKQPGYSFIFEGGGYDGFSHDQVGAFLDVSGCVSKDAASYEFRNVGQLDADYRAGRFSSSFEEGRELDSAFRSAPEARDMFKEEWKRAASRPRNEALEKHGPALEVEIMNQLRRERAEPLRSETRGQRPATALSSLDRRAHAAYEEYCEIQQTPTTEAGRNEWVTAWRELAEEQRRDAVDMERVQAPQWPKAEPQEHDRDPDMDLDR